MWILTAAIFIFASGVSSLSVAYNTTCSSSYSEYRCGDGGCVNVTTVCDGNADCDDGSDEEYCDSETNPLQLDHLIEHPVLRRKRQDQCGLKQWRCDDGNCISLYGVCDGIRDCPDGGDETFALCRKNNCLAHWFRCTYGACVDGNAPCNNIQDCADNSDELLPRCRNQTENVRGQFKCYDGSTIPAYSHCDGTRDCADGSDETLRECAGKKCIGYVFQCAYGACVDGHAACNGIEECADGSDESDELCKEDAPPKPAEPPKNILPVKGGKCILPQFPEHGSYIVAGAPFARPGQTFNNLALNVTCHPGYNVLGSTEKICYDGIWSDETYKCVQFCRLNKHPSVEYNCALPDGQNGVRPCEAFEPDGTVVIPTCNSPNYYFNGVLGYMRCIEGSWDYTARCNPECGLVTPNGAGLIGGPEGKPALKGELPWHTGIYNKELNYRQICGGSLVAPRVVISAAHCFWNKQTQRKEPDSWYAVALGKIARQWQHPDEDENEIQRSDVEKVRLPPYFQGSRTNFQNDLAIVQLVETITYYPHIRPVCISFNGAIQSLQLVDGKRGKVAGWGLDGADGNPSEILQTVNLPYVSVEECLRDSPASFRVYITGDKICAGFRNGSAVCHGDSGGGLTFASREERGLDRYYLRGVVSIAPGDGHKCNINWLTTFTLISRLEDFIKPYL